MEHPQLIKPIFKKIISINQKLLNMKKIESPKKTKQNNYTSSKAKNATEIKKTKPKKCQKLSTMEDKSTNYNEYINYKVEFNIPHLFTVDAETESEFLNIKLGESDSIIDKPKESKIKSKIYDDSREIYDFTDKTHVDFVLNNLSILSDSFSFNNGYSSNFLDDCNRNEISGDNKIVNKLKIFNTKQSIPSLKK